MMSWLIYIVQPSTCQNNNNIYNINVYASKVDVPCSTFDLKRAPKIRHVLGHLLEVIVSMNFGGRSFINSLLDSSL